MHPIEIDLGYQDLEGAASAFLLKTSDGPILVESGPSSTLGRLSAGLRSHDVEPEDITHVFLSHIHMDHAGAAGWFAQHGAMIHVHPRGRPHLADPSRLNASALRIYGDRLEGLLGEMVPCPEEKLHATADGEQVTIGELTFTAIETLGHAGHHHAWATTLDGERTCFTGDVAGMRIPDSNVVTVPLAPPELDPKAWLNSIDRLEAGHFDSLVLTHSGPVNLIGPHLEQVRKALEGEIALLTTLLEDEKLDQDTRIERYLEPLHLAAIEEGVPPEIAKAHLSPGYAAMNLMGVQRHLTRQNRSRG